MAATDYTVRVQGLQFCPVANVVGRVNPLQVTLPLRSLKTTRAGDMYTGMLAMLGSELVKVTSISANSVTVDRGCGDTIPTAWPDGTIIWFLDTLLRGDSREYGGTSTITAKVLPRTSSGTTAVTAAPPQQITFNSRFIRPYPPGAVKVDGDRWFEVAPTLSVTADTAVLTWAHRNRVTQADTPVAHDGASIPPEAGQGYVLLARTTAGAPLGTIDAGTGTTYSLLLADLCSALGYASDSGTHDVVLWLHSRRDGHDSLAGYPITVHLDTTDMSPSNKLLLEGSGLLLREAGGRIKLENN